MFIFTFLIMTMLMLFVTNKLLNISDDNSVGYSYSRQDSFIVLGLLVFGIVLQLLPLKGHKIYWVAIIFYAFIIFIIMIVLAARKKIIVTKQREELQQVFEVLEPVLPKNSELDMNNPPFKLGYDKNQINKIVININPNTFKDTVAVNLCLSLNRYLPNYEWINENDFAARECSFIGTPLPPGVAKYKGSWLRPAEFIPIGLSGKGEVSWNINSIKDEGRSCYIYEDGKIAQTVDNPSAPQALCVGSPLGLDTLIPTTKGYKTMKTIEVGDEVFGLDNQISKVLQVHEIHKADVVYKLTFATDFYSIDIISDEIHRFPVVDHIRMSLSDTDYFKPVTCKDLQEGMIVEGGNRAFKLIKKVKVEPQLVRCITVNNKEHIFKVAVNQEKDWNGGTEYKYPSIYTYNTGGGKAIYVNQKVNVQ